MWNTDQLGRATWIDRGCGWLMDARGGKHGIGLWLPQSDQRAVSLSPVDQASLPEAAEQFVRGDAWYVNYPQGDGRFAMRLAFRPIETTEDRLLVEVLISIQTDLLDSHPKIDIDIDCQSIDSIATADQNFADQGAAAGVAPIYLANGSGYSCSVLLGPHDRPFTTSHSTVSSLRLRLFGEFLEKGVIRRGRPWIVIDRSGKPIPEDWLLQRWQQLAASPLPLS